MERQARWGQARPGRTGQGMAWYRRHGKACTGSEWLGAASQAWQGMHWLGVARRGIAGTNENRDQRYER